MGGEKLAWRLRGQPTASILRLYLLPHLRNRNLYPLRTV